MVAGFHRNSQYYVIFGSFLLARIANSCKWLALSNIVQICYWIARCRAIPRWQLEFKMVTVFQWRRQPPKSGGSEPCFFAGEQWKLQYTYMGYPPICEKILFNGFALIPRGVWTEVGGPDPSIPPPWRRHCCFYYYMQYFVMGNLKFYVSWNCQSLGIISSE